MIIHHFEFRETKGKDYFRKAWAFSFVSKGQFVKGIYHQDGTIEWEGQSFIGPDKDQVIKELHELMAFHIFR